MKPLALIVDDDSSTRGEFADRLESLGHQYEEAGSQKEAREQIRRAEYNYVILDLDLPVRSGRPPSFEVGKNALREIRTNPLNRLTPVIAVAPRCLNIADLVVDVMTSGANDFLIDPYERLEQSVHRAVDLPPVGDRHGRHRRASATQQKPGHQPRQLLVFQPDGITLDGVILCTPDNGVIWRILMLIRQRKENGQPKAFPGKRIAELLGLNRGQNAVCDAISPFRHKVVDLMHEGGTEGDAGSLIMTGRAGYQINPALAVEDHMEQAPSVTTTSKDAAREWERQEWFLAELAKGRQLRRSDLEDHFRISTATAKRDLCDLTGRIEFIGTGASGYYVAVP